MELLEIKDLIENNPVGLATVTLENKPNVIGVNFVKVIGEEEILITDNFMNQTVKDILENKNVCLIVWNNRLEGCKLIGEAEYFTEGKWKKFAEEMEENIGLPAKGALIIKVSKIIKLR